MAVDPNAAGFNVHPANRKCDMCERGAIIWFRGGNVCYGCYISLHRKDAARYCAEHGLDTTEKKIEHCRKLLGLFVERQKQPEREPGSDDE